MTLNIVVPRAEQIDTDQAGRSRRLGALYRWGESRVTIALNIVTSLNGSLTDAEGLSHGLSNPSDRAILAAIRHPADVLAVGVSTARAEQYTTPRELPLAVVTRTGDATGLNLAPESELIVLAPGSVAVRADPRVRARHVPIPESDDLDATAIASALAGQGYRRVLFEGGGTLAAAMARAPVLDDLFLSLSPQLMSAGVGWLHRPEKTAQSQSLSLCHVIHDTEHDALYTRWHREA